MKTYTPVEVRDLLRQALTEGESFVVIERSGYTQVGLRSASGEVFNITPAVWLAYGLPHKGLSIAAKAAHIESLLPALEKPVKPMVTRISKQTPDFDKMSNDEICAYILAHPDEISASKSRVSA